MGRLVCDGATTPMIVSPLHVVQHVLVHCSCVGCAHHLGIAAVCDPEDTPGQGTRYIARTSHPESSQWIAANRSSASVVGLRWSCMNIATISQAVWSTKRAPPSSGQQSSCIRLTSMAGHVTCRKVTRRIPFPGRRTPGSPAGRVS